MDRRTFLAASAGLLLWPATSLARQRRVAGLSPELTKALEKSGFVYVSPLRSDGAESTCHGEVWYAWLDGAVVLNTASSTWKSRAVGRGLDRTRIWVGDHGRWKGRLGGRNEDFRKAPSFEARAELSKDEKLLERLLAKFEEKYPDEIADWRDRMRKGFHSGDRVLIRYVPDGAAQT